MEAESGAKIAIRGKGSVKEGKGRSDAAHSSNQEEDLHCLIMADTEEKVQKAKKLIHNVIETVCSHFLSLSFVCIVTLWQTNAPQAASIPEGQNELKRNQLRELAALNGTLRDDENQACQNCKFCSLSSFRRRIYSDSIFRWPNWASQVRLPRTAQLHGKHHLPCLWKCRTHGPRLSRSPEGYRLA